MVNIGEKLWQLRIKNGLTLEGLASRCELTKGFLSQLENNMTSPSISTLSDILEALGTTPAEFFKESKSNGVTFGEDDYFEDKRDGYTINWIVPDAQKRAMEPLIIELEGEAKSFEMEPHEGEEFGYVLKGKIKLVFQDHEVKVNQGETFYVSGSSDYYIQNTTKSKAKVLWVANPPSF